MIYSFSINALMGLIFLVTMFFTLKDIDAAINDPFGYSFIWIPQQALPNSPASISAITAVLIILSLASNIR
jgi:hypothetical protein